MFPDVIKPVIDVVWFTYQTYRLLGMQNTVYLFVSPRKLDIFGVF